jgi:hypothetical protein
MKTKNNIIVALSLLVAITLSSQVILSVDSEGMTQSGNTVSAIGSFEYENGKFSGWIQNTSNIPSFITGVWLLGPDVSAGSDVFVSKPWDYVGFTNRYLSNIVSFDNRESYFGFNLDISQYGFEPALKPLEILEFSFEVEGIFEDVTSLLPDVIFRFQRVGVDKEDGLKLIGTFVDGPTVPISEPATVGIFSGLVALWIILIRRRYCY